MNSNYLALDTETGGISNCSLLTAYFSVLDSNLNPVDSLDLKIKPADGLYHVTAEGLKVNGINLVEHDPAAITEKEAGTILYEFLKRHTDGGKVKLIPIGHNIPFDIDSIKHKLVASWNQFVSYRILDTSSIAQFLRVKGILPADLSGSMESLAKYYGVTVNGLHTAKGDTDATVEILRRMIRES